MINGRKARCLSVKATEKLCGQLRFARTNYFDQFRPDLHTGDPEWLNAVWNRPKHTRGIHFASFWVSGAPSGAFRPPAVHGGPQGGPGARLHGFRA